MNEKEATEAALVALLDTCRRAMPENYGVTIILWTRDTGLVTGGSTAMGFIDDAEILATTGAMYRKMVAGQMRFKVEHDAGPAS